MLRTVALAGLLAVALVPAALAQSPEVPSPSNPFPFNPVATDGTPLPSQAAPGSPYGYGGPIASGRSVGFDAPGVLAPAGGFLGTATGTAGSLVGGVLGLR